MKLLVVLVACFFLFVGQVEAQQPQFVSCESRLMAVNNSSQEQAFQLYWNGILLSPPALSPGEVRYYLLEPNVSVFVIVNGFVTQVPYSTHPCPAQPQGLLPLYTVVRTPVNGLLPLGTRVYWGQPINIGRICGYYATGYEQDQQYYVLWQESYPFSETFALFTGFGVFPNNVDPSLCGGVTFVPTPNPVPPLTVFQPEICSPGLSGVLYLQLGSVPFVGNEKVAIYKTNVEANIWYQQQDIMPVNNSGKIDALMYCQDRSFNQNYVGSDGKIYSINSWYVFVVNDQPAVIFATLAGRSQQVLITWYDKSRLTVDPLTHAVNQG